MINLTEYLREKQINIKETTRRFFRMARVKYIIASDPKFNYNRIPGRKGGTYLSNDLFEVFKEWLDKKPLPLLNRKEYEVSEFIQSYFDNKAILQFKCGKYFLDWFIPQHNLAVEFYEKDHSYKKKSDNDRIEFISKEMDVFIIKEESVMYDLALLSIKYRPINN